MNMNFCPFKFINKVFLSYEKSKARPHLLGRLDYPVLFTSISSIRFYSNKMEESYRREHFKWADSEKHALWRQIERFRGEMNTIGFIFIPLFSLSLSLCGIIFHILSSSFSKRKVQGKRKVGFFLRAIYQKTILRTAAFLSLSLSFL